MTTTTNANNNALSTLNAKVAAAKAHVQTDALQKLADNEVFVQVLAQQELKADGIDTLKNLVNQVTALTESRSRLFGYGEAVDLIVQLTSSWLYSKAEVKPLVEAVIPSVPKYGEDLLNAAGRLPYYSKTLNTVMDGDPMDVDTFKALVLALGTELGIYVQVSQLTNEHTNALYTRATMRADLSEKESQNTAILKNNALEL